jgi:hypothetical protein
VTYSRYHSAERKASSAGMSACHPVEGPVLVIVARVMASSMSMKKTRKDHIRESHKTSTSEVITNKGLKIDSLLLIGLLPILSRFGLSCFRCLALS